MPRRGSRASRARRSSAVGRPRLRTTGTADCHRLRASLLTAPCLLHLAHWRGTVGQALMIRNSLITFRGDPARPRSGSRKVKAMASQARQRRNRAAGKSETTAAQDAVAQARTAPGTVPGPRYPRPRRVSRRARRRRARRRGEAATASPVSDEQLRAFYRDMLLIRRFEERAARAYTEALIGGYCHLNLGEEAAVVGLMAALRPTDYLFTNYREHGYALMRGIEPEPGDGRAVRPRRRRLQGLGRVDAHVRRHPPAARRVRHRRRPAAAGDRRGARHRLPGRRRGRHVHRWATAPPPSAPSTSR